MQGLQRQHIACARQCWQFCELATTKLTARSRRKGG